MMRDSYVLYKERLNGEYLTVFEQVEGYTHTQMIDDSSMEEKLGELLDIFISSQEAGKSVNTLTGDDIRRFCRIFVSDCSWKQRLLRMIDILKNLAWFAALLCLIDILPEIYTSGSIGEFFKAVSVLNTSILVACAFIPTLLGTVINLVVVNIMLRSKHFSMNVMSVVSFAVYLLLLLPCYAAIDNLSPTVNFPLLITLWVSMLFLVIYYITNYKRLKELNKYKVNLLDTVSVDVGSQYDQLIMKRYYKEKQKRVKMGKSELSFGQFLDNEEKRCEKNYKIEILYKSIPYVATLGDLGNRLITKSYDSYVGLCFSIVGVFIFEYLIMRWLWSIIKKSNDIQMSWIKKKKDVIAQCDEEDQE